VVGLPILELYRPAAGSCIVGHICFVFCDFPGGGTPYTGVVPSCCRLVNSSTDSVSNLILDIQTRTHTWDTSRLVNSSTDSVSELIQLYLNLEP
jgi:hypothetical protein